MFWLWRHGTIGLWLDGYKAVDPSQSLANVFSISVVCIYNCRQPILTGSDGALDIGFVPPEILPRRRYGYK